MSIGRGSHRRLQRRYEGVNSRRWRGFPRIADGVRTIRRKTIGNRAIRKRAICSRAIGRVGQFVTGLLVAWASSRSKKTFLLHFQAYIKRNSGKRGMVRVCVKDKAQKASQKSPIHTEADSAPEAARSQDQSYHSRPKVKWSSQNKLSRLSDKVHQRNTIN